MIEELRSYYQIINPDCLVIDFYKIEEALHKYKDKILRIKRLPSIIDPEKQYPNFELLKRFKDSHSKRILLVSFEEKERTEKIQIKLKYGYFGYNEMLKLILPSEVEVPNSFQTIGKIVHLNLNERQMGFKNIIGEVLLDKVKNIETVVTKIGKIESEFRESTIEIISGKRVLQTFCMENNLVFFVDYGKVYWNSKLQSERKKLLGMFKKGDVILDPFCGVGPIVIPAAKKGCIVYGNDLNPVAIDCLKKNIEINSIDREQVFLENKDAGIFLQRFRFRKVDHIIFNLPEKGVDFLGLLGNFDEKATLHCYFFCRNEIMPKDIVTKYINLESKKWSIVHIRNVSPSKKMYKLQSQIKDIICTKS